jgi:hypothetical protein
LSAAQKSWAEKPTTNEKIGLALVAQTFATRAVRPDFLRRSWTTRCTRRHFFQTFLLVVVLFSLKIIHNARVYDQLRFQSAYWSSYRKIP